MKKIGLFMVILLLSALIAGCAMQVAQPKEVKIGAVVSLTGKSSNLGNDMWRAAQLAAEEINAQGGVYIKELNTKVPIKMVAGDDESTPDGGQKAVTKLILSDNVSVLVGGYSSAVVPVHEPIVLEHKIPYIISGASNPIVTRRTDIDTSYFFHHCPTTADYGRYTTLFIDQAIRPEINRKFNYSSDRPLRLGLIYVDTAFGQGVVAAINKTVTEDNLAIQISAQQGFAATERDFRTLLTAMKASKPDVVYFASDPDQSVVIVSQARREVGLDPIFVAVENNDDPTYYTGIKQYGDYSIIESRFSPYLAPKDIADANIKYKEAFKAKYGTYPGMMATSTYEAVYIAAKAIENAGTLDTPAIRDALANLEMPQLVEPMNNGMITFSKDFHESKFRLSMEQLYWDEAIGECRPKIVWPDELKETDFKLPDWYKPGSP